MLRERREGGEAVGRHSFPEGSGLPWGLTGHGCLSPWSSEAPVGEPRFPGAPLNSWSSADALCSEYRELGGAGF